MTDKKWQIMMDRTTKYHSLYRKNLQIIENEYIRRFGIHPSDWDDDSWIDSFHQSPYGSTVEEVEKQANFSRFLHGN